ncbi:MAG: iduronate-2-sulfatase [Verrucomicrobiaceae bacterium TMED137]|nr:MAG: iduronate-2-sulfatase [Verrucomicrobiaceae bacterium TMED137]HAE19844.1 iduronate-2-sulfatase [Verrucomicrobiales bacterium]
MNHLLATLALISLSAFGVERPNVLFIISDDLTATALSCYGNTVCKTPNIDRLASQGTRFTKAYCQGTYCGPSRASFMSGYYPHAIKMLGYGSPRPAIGERATWAQHFKNNGYHTARVSKIFHMGVPGGIEKGTDGADDPASWTERFNSAGPEWKAPGDGETLENNADGRKPGPVGGNTFVVVEADGNDLVHSDGKTAAKAVELIKQNRDKPFFLGVGFVRPHVPFVAPRKDYTDFLPYSRMQLPPKLKDDWADIPKAGINYKTSKNMKMDVRRQKKAVGGYYASVAFMDRMVGQVLNGLEEAGLEDNTIVIFTSDHGYHLGEHDFWAKVSLHDESAAVPLIIRMPGKKPAVCHSLVELLDLYPTLSNLCGLEVPKHLQGKDISKMMTDPAKEVRSAAFSVNGKGFLLREQDWAYIAYGKNGQGDEELFDMKQDPKQFTNLAKDPKHAQIIARFQKQMATKLKEVRTNDLGLKY